MKSFSKEEKYALAIILGAIIIVSAPNFVISLRLSRDAQRKTDIGSIYSALNEFQADFGSFPLSKNGQIAVCEPVAKKVINGLETFDFSPCVWGKDSLKDLSDPAYPPYLKTLPQDPYFSRGVNYYYLSNGSRYQIYGALEGKGEDEYDEKIIARQLPCGNKICNFGKAFGKTPLDKSIEEYENEINAKK